MVGLAFLDAGAVCPGWRRQHTEKSGHRPDRGCVKSERVDASRRPGCGRIGWFVAEYGRQPWTSTGSADQPSVSTLSVSRPVGSPPASLAFTLAAGCRDLPAWFSTRGSDPKSGYLARYLNEPVRDVAGPAQRLTGPGDCDASTNPTLKVIWWLLIGVLAGGLREHGTGMTWSRNTAALRRQDRPGASRGDHTVDHTGKATRSGSSPRAAHSLRPGRCVRDRFSGFYWAMLAFLWALFFRPVGFDYRSKIHDPAWRRAWTGAGRGGACRADLRRGVRQPAARGAVRAGNRLV